MHYCWAATVNSNEALVVDPSSFKDIDTQHKKVVIIGAGPVGIQFANKLLSAASSPMHVYCFNGEKYLPYDRIKLSQVLTQSIQPADIFWQPAQTSRNYNNPKSRFDLIHQTIHEIDAHKHIVKDTAGNTYPYDYLVLATGSKPHIPSLPGIEMTGVYTFRNMRDVEFLMARTHRSRHTVVIGGGLLGLEAAKGLLQKNTKVTLVHQSNRLMNRQLDELNAKNLEQQVAETGIDIITNDGLQAVCGEHRADGIITRTGQHIQCDTVVLCTGIKPNTQLALSAGIKINRGILIDDTLRTNIPNVYAIGECTEHNNEVFGLVAPGLEQASVLASQLTGGSAEFKGSAPYTKLKVLDIDVNSFGETADFVKHPKLKIIHHRKRHKKGETNKVTRSLAFINGKIIGACGIGEWTELQRIRESQTQTRRIYPWQQWLFYLTGKLWFLDNSSDPNQWAPAAIICQCNQVPLETINTAIANGNHTVESIGNVCGAGQVCGSCQPLLQAITAQSNADNIEPEKFSFANAKLLTTLSTLAILAVAALAFIPALQTPDSVQEQSLAWLVQDKFFKQVSGFSLLGVTIIGLILSLRKRLRWEFLGKFSNWRLIHTGMGVIALSVLLAHTGANLGEQLNRWLMLNFLLVSVIGGTLGLAIAFSSSQFFRDRLRKFSFWLHVLTVWPLPILIGAHVLSSYYF